ncbi:orotidine-5'-phosphate decarboxylase [Marinococcus halophilus]|uniref:Orotidine 5'-phosphate decarboxylase n=1 Tax=Marinococcus halophilus TaxID=1371 RepID=A0A510Y452_MARHA|nr:orotidine-5'-phosphate decarboxylase [Marinococcus halophilus]OZT81384.1 orotidine-5'-phosphate decarboxylase [Marinococcus halophilus]GEK57337.1 orotidine 5'-phosphate decarboxylase [Marinococcus halophilus]
MNDHPLIIAMDVPDKSEADALLASFGQTPLFLKVGMELFYKEGPALVEEWKAEGHRVFLDLKLHDIPNTVQRAAAQLARLQVDLVTVHAAGGSRMMARAVEGLEQGTPFGKKRPACIAVTQLTSTSEAVLNEELGIPLSMNEAVTAYADLAERSGQDGVVCAAGEVPLIKSTCSRSFLTVTPGIRRAGEEAGDQTRVVTPGVAAELGSDAIVVGRSITGAIDPTRAYEQMEQEWRMSDAK